MTHQMNIEFAERYLEIEQIDIKRITEGENGDYSRVFGEYNNQHVDIECHTLERAINFAEKVVGRELSDNDFENLTLPPNPGNN